MFDPQVRVEPIPGLPGFRRVAGTPAAPQDTTTALREWSWSGLSPCDLLFTAPRAAGDVPIAYFSDYNCGFCRHLSPRLADLATAADVSVTWHELPLLGPASTRAARAALAARKQGAHVAFHARLMDRSGGLADATLRDLARREGLDPDRLIADMDAPGVTRQLAITADLGRRFGFVGTPALVIGRTAALGALSDARLENLIALERQEATPPCA